MQWENDEDGRKIASAPPSIYPNTSFDNFRMTNITNLQTFVESELEKYRRHTTRYKGILRGLTKGGLALTSLGSIIGGVGISFGIGLTSWGHFALGLG